MIALRVGLRRFEVKITALSCDLEMGLGCATSSLAASLASLLATGDHALLATEGRLTLAIIAWIVDRVSFRIRQEGLQPHIQADVRMVTCRGSMLCLGVSFADDEGIPVMIGPIEQVTGLGSPFDRAMQLDLERTAQLLGDRQMLAIRGKFEIRFVLAQVNRVPTVGGLKAREPTCFAKFSAGKEAFEGLIQAICQHLDS